MECYAVVRGRGFLAFAAAWMEMGSIVLGEIGQAEGISHDLICGI